MSHKFKGNYTPITPEWPNIDGESIFMEDASFHTPCWRHWLNRQKVSGVKELSWDELHDLWTDAFGAVEMRAPKNTSLAEIERILHKPGRRPAPRRTRASNGARLSAPTTAFEGRFYSRSNAA